MKEIAKYHLVRTKETGSNSFTAPNMMALPLSCPRMCLICYLRQTNENRQSSFQDFLKSQVRDQVSFFLLSLVDWWHAWFHVCLRSSVFLWGWQMTLTQKKELHQPSISLVKPLFLKNLVNLEEETATIFSSFANLHWLILRQTD